MTLLELQKVLGERIEIANSKDVDAETRKTENETSQVIASLAKQMINNADVVLRADKLCNSHERIDKVVGSWKRTQKSRTIGY